MFLRHVTGFIQMGHILFGFTTSNVNYQICNVPLALQRLVDTARVTTLSRCCSGHLEHRHHTNIFIWEIRNQYIYLFRLTFNI